ncbi:MAG: response regulator transcription factor [Cyanobacteriota bacterium]|jgi:DNA-binding NarL/FixJ family response regulator
MKLLIVEDNTQLAECLALELESEGFEPMVVGTGAAALARLRQAPAPEMVILDWDLPDFSGLDVFRSMLRQGPTPPVLMLTCHDEVSDRVQALDLGIDDYLVKPFSIDELLARIRALKRRQERSRPQPAPELAGLLTAREQEVLAGIAAGRTNGEIAQQLFLSHETVKSHVKAILQKLGARDRTQALVLALKAGLVELPETVPQDPARHP